MEWKAKKRRAFDLLLVMGAAGVGAQAAQYGVSVPGVVWVGLIVAQLVALLWTAWKCRRELVEHRLRIDLEWDETQRTLERFNANAAKLHGDVQAQASRFRETFGIESLPHALNPKLRVN